MYDLLCDVIKDEVDKLDRRVCVCVGGGGGGWGAGKGSE